MKYFRLIIFGLTLTMNLKAQTFNEKVALKTCDCLDSLETLKQLEDSLINCTSNAMALVMIESPPSDKNMLGNTEGIIGVFKEVKEILPLCCYNVRRLMVEEKKQHFYKISNFSTANEHYKKGNDLMEKGDYTNSIIEFQNAIKIDKNFIYAYDHIAIAYRRQEDFKKAIKYYQKSLDIFPEGELALLNIAMAYSLLKDYDKSLKYYNALIYFYKNNPEGYFGACKVSIIKTDYENALENIFIAHRIYKETNSNYKKDCEELIGILYSELKDKGKFDLFSEKAKKYNFSINE